MFKLSPNGKGMIFGVNRIWPQWKSHYGANLYTPMTYSLNGKSMVL